MSFGNRTVMKKLVSIIKQEEFRVFFFLLALLMFVYPLIAPSILARLDFLFCYLFIAWFIVVAVLFYAFRNHDAPQKQDDNDNTDV